MTWRKKTIMEMAREAGICTWLKPPADVVERIEAFEALVREDEAQKYKRDVHSCGPTCTKIGCVAMREAVLAEREACAKVCEKHGYDHYCGNVTDKIAETIRARGNKHENID